MMISSVSLLLGLCVLVMSVLTVSAVSLDVSPNFQQFFRGDSTVFLSCVDEWTVKRTNGRDTEVCGAAADLIRVNSSFCVLDLSISSGGSFLCDNLSGKKSDEVSISVLEDGVILEIPALPVRTGSDVTLHCKTRDGSSQKSYFFRYDHKIVSKAEVQLILSNVQQSNEGFYSCSTAIHPRSPLSRLRVTDASLPTTSTNSPLAQATRSSSSIFCCNPPTSSSDPFPSPFMTLPLFLLLLPAVLIMVLIVGILLWRKQRATSTLPLKNEEITYADVTFRQTANKRVRYSADPDMVYSGVRTHTAGK
ncbi:unnamed protein product [Oreochromis niloticus]|nr:unnamed protein product [Mustela putorius furo]